METKICVKCKQEKLLNEFYFRKSKNKYDYSCKKCENERTKKYYKYNYEKAIQYYNNNKNEIRLKRREYQKNKRINDTVFALKGDLRTSILNYFKNSGRVGFLKMEKITGLKQQDFRQYLLKTFFDKYGYEYNNNEEVNIDHIIPLKLCKTEQEVIKAFYYTNLQLLKKEDNVKKGTNLI